MAFGETTRAAMVRAPTAPPLSTPAVHTPVTGSKLPWLGAADTNVSPAGSRSVTSTALAGSGPVLDSDRVNVTVSPTFGAALSTALVRRRSAWRGVTPAEAELSVESGSNWSAAVM